MRTSRKALFVTLILLVAFLSSPLAIIPYVKADAVTVDTSTTYTAVQFGYMRTGFYAEGRFWAFYHDGTNAVYESTVNPAVWAGGVTSIGVCDEGIQFSVWFDGTYVHYVRYDDVNDDLFYRRGDLEADGSITWSAVEQRVYDGDADDHYERPCISVDSGGYAWIGATRDSLPDDTPYALKNANNDGTWALDFATELSASASLNWQVCPVPLTSAKVYMIYCRADFFPRGKLYDAGFGAEESDLGDYAIEKAYTFCAVADGDNVHFVYNRVGTYQIRHNRRVFCVGWDANDVLVQDAVTSYCSPALSINTATSDLYCFWTSNIADHVYYKQYTGGVWDVAPTDWINEEVDDIEFDEFISSYYQDYDRHIGLLYLTETASPYKVRFNYLTVEMRASMKDYGEDEDYLGQIVDSYLNNDSVQATYNAIHNSNLECMEILDYGPYNPQPQQVLFGGYYDLLSPTTIEYNSLIGGYIWTETVSWRFKLVTTDGIIKNLRVKLSGAPGAGNHYTFTLMVNGNPTALTFDISDTETTGGNMVNEIDVEPTDAILLRCAPDGTPNAVYATWTSIFMADADCESILSGGSGFALNNTATEYVGLVAGSSNYGTTEASHNQVCPTSGTIKNLYVELSRDPGTSPDAYRWTLRKGGVNQALTVTITADDNTGGDWVNSFDVVAGDILTMMIEPLNTPSETPHARWGMTFVSDINGESILLGGSSNNLPQVNTEYHQITPAYYSYSWITTEAERYQLGQVCTLKKFYVTLAGSPGAGTNYNFTLRLGGSDSNIFTTISDAETSGNSGILEDVVVLDEYANIRVVPTGSPTIRDAYWGMVCYIETTEAPFGVYYTKEMLDGDRALNMMYNVSISETTAITMEFSEDNSTWVDHDNQSGYEDLIAGFESLDLRDINATAIYFRFNMTGDCISTPRVYQLRLVTITDVVLGDANIPAINEIVFNTTIAETVCEIYGDFSDAEGLSGYIFWNNATSAPGGVNSSFTVLTGTSNSTHEDVTLPVSGSHFGVKYYVNDTDGNWGVDTLAMFPSIEIEADVTTYIGGQGQAGIIIFCAALLIPLILGVMKK